MLTLTLEEALLIKKSLKKKQEMKEAGLGNVEIRLYPTWLNILAGICESWCDFMKTNRITRTDLETIRKLHKNHWLESGMKDQKSWAKMTQVEKILEQWNDVIEAAEADEPEGHSGGASQTEQSDRESSESGLSVKDSGNGVKGNGQES